VYQRIRANKVSQAAELAELLAAPHCFTMQHAGAGAVKLL
jgi:hypothetical protein